MQRKNLWLASLLVVGCLGLVAGCSADAAEPIDDAIDIDSALDGSDEEVAEDALTAISECEFESSDGSVVDFYPKDGGFSVFNVTTRAASCRTANLMAKSYYNSQINAGASFNQRGYTCTTSFSFPFGPQADSRADVRCTKGERVVRFQASA